MRAEALACLGRHAEAVRVLDAALGELRRRLDWTGCAAVLLMLGRLRLMRGAVQDAERHIRDAGAACAGGGAVLGAAGVAVHLGWLLLEDDRLEECERHLTGARADVEAAGDGETAVAIRLLRAHAACWRGRHPEAWTLIETAGGACDCGQWQVADVAPSPGWRAATSWQGRLPPPSVPLLARLVRGRLGCVEGRGQPAVAEAMPGRPLSSAIDCLAMHEAALLELCARREWDQAGAELDRGLAAARAAHAPLAALSLRLTSAECALRYGAPSSAAFPGAPIVLDGWAKVPLPGLLRRRLADVRGGRRTRTGCPVAPDATPLGGAPAGIVTFLQALNGAGDELTAVERASAEARRLSGAAALTVYGRGAGGAVALLAHTGGRACDAGLARRLLESGAASGTDAAASSSQLVLPIRFAGSCVGAVGARWPGAAGAPAGGAALLEAFASVCAASVSALLSRTTTDPPGGTPVGEIVGISSAARDLRTLVLKVAATPFPVLIEGESGTGKELAARAIHLASPRRTGRWCAVNCAAIADELVEAELFGYVRGAFTGAVGDRPGLFEEAHGGTLFLDEVGELSARAQAKLLRVIQEGEIRRLGENRHRRVDVRIIAATNRSLRDECAHGRFRTDLLYRLDVVGISVPPLRERPEDIPLLVEKFWRSAASQAGSRAVLSAEAVAALAGHEWPGNIRELQNTLTALAAQGPRLGRIGAREVSGALGRRAPSGPCQATTLDEARRRFDERFVAAALARAGGRRSRAAASLGVTRQGLAKLMMRLGMDVGIAVADASRATASSAASAGGPAGPRLGETAPGRARR